MVGGGGGGGVGTAAGGSAFDFAASAAAAQKKQIGRPAALSSSVGRDSVYGMQGAAVDLWALASSRILFRSGESTFGMLAAAMHHTPIDVVVRNTSNPACRLGPNMVAAAVTNGSRASSSSTSAAPAVVVVPAFCSAKRGKEEPMACPCAAARVE